MNIIKYLAEGIYKSNFFMSLFFFNEIIGFILTGMLLTFNNYFAIITFIISLFFAFVLGEAIKIRARRGY
jgi:hypothetical protein